MSYPGDPAGQQQPPYQYSDGGYQQPPPGGYQQPPPGGYQQPPGGYQQPPGGYQAPQPGGYGAPPQSGPPAGQPAYQPEATPYGGGYGYDPNSQASGPPISGGPYSGPPMTPVSGPAMSSGGTAMLPQVGPMAAPARAGRGPLTPILAGLVALFFIATAVLAVLYITKSGDYTDAKNTAAQRQDNINSLNSDVAKLKADLQKVTDERDAARRDLGGAQGQADELKRQKQVISHCIQLIGEASAAARAGDTATANAKNTEATPVCNEAGQYLD
jgi:hypothetical protein